MTELRVEHRHHPGRTCVAHVHQRVAAVLGTALLITASSVPIPASAHYVQPPGEQEAAVAVVQVQVSYNYLVDVPGKGGEAGLYAATVPGPRGTGAVVSSSGAVLTGRASAMAERGEQQELIAVNLAFRARYGLPWTEPQLAQRQRVDDEQINSGLRACYATLDRCARFGGRSRTVVFNTEPARRLSGRYNEIDDGLAILSTRFDRARTPTVGISSAAPQPGGQYRAVGWDQKRLLPPLPMTFEDGAFRVSDLEKVADTYANRGDGVVIVDSASKGDVVAVVVPGEDGKPVAMPPLKALQFGGVAVDRGPLHPMIDQALGYFEGHHYGHALPLIEQVTRLIPDRGLLGKLQVARAKGGGPEDKSNDPSSSMSTADAPSSSWTIAAAALTFAAVAAAAAVLWSRRRQEQAGRAERDDEDDDFDLEELDGEPDPAPQKAVVGAPSEHGEQLQHAAAGMTAARQAEIYCSQCGVTLLAGDRFCYHCGTPVR